MVDAGITKDEKEDLWREVLDHDANCQVRVSTGNLEGIKDTDLSTNTTWYTLNSARQPNTMTGSEER